MEKGLLGKSKYLCFLVLALLIFTACSDDSSPTAASSPIASQTADPLASAAVGSNGSNKANVSAETPSPIASQTADPLVSAAVGSNESNEANDSAETPTQIKVPKYLFTSLVFDVTYSGHSWDVMMLVYDDKLTGAIVNSDAATPFYSQAEDQLELEDRNTMLASAQEIFDMIYADVQNTAAQGYVQEYYSDNEIGGPIAAIGDAFILDRGYDKRTAEAFAPAENGNNSEMDGQLFEFHDLALRANRYASSSTTEPDNFVLRFDDRLTLALTHEAIIPTESETDSYAEAIKLFSETRDSYRLITSLGDNFNHSIVRAEQNNLAEHGIYTESLLYTQINSTENKFLVVTIYCDMHIYHISFSYTSDEGRNKADEILRTITIKNTVLNLALLENNTSEEIILFGEDTEETVGAETIYQFGRLTLQADVGSMYGVSPTYSAFNIHDMNIAVQIYSREEREYIPDPNEKLKFVEELFENEEQSLLTGSNEEYDRSWNLKEGKMFVDASSGVYAKKSDLDASWTFMQTILNVYDELSIHYRLIFSYDVEPNAVNEVNRIIDSIKVDGTSLDI